MTELQILKECNHPNIIKSYGAFPTENGITIALEYMNSGSLAGIIQKLGCINESMLGMITVQLLNGLDYLHTVRRIIHNDIKPENILFSTNGAVKIADFGVSNRLKKDFDHVNK